MSAALDLPPRSLPLAYSDVPGQTSAAPVVFVHGFGHHRGVWQGTLDRLGPARRCITIDLRGHGDSPWSPINAYDLDDYAADFGPLFDSLGLRSAHVVAHSMGGQIAMLFAAENAHRVRSLTLVDTGPALRTNASAHVLDEIEDAFRILPSVDAYRHTLSQLHPFADAALLDAMARGGVARRLDGRFELALDPGVMGQRPIAGDAETATEREARLWSAFRAIDAPKLVLRGRLSSVLDEEAARAMARVGGPTCQLVQLDGAGHAIMIDACDDFATELAEFLDRVAPPDSTAEPS